MKSVYDTFVDDYKKITSFELTEKKGNAKSDVNKRFKCMYCGWEKCVYTHSYNRTYKNSEINVSCYFSHNSSGDDPKDYKKCIFFMNNEHSLPKNERKLRNEIRKNILYYYEKWYPYVAEEWNSHIFSKMIPNSNQNYNPIEGVNRFIYFFNSIQNREKIETIILNHNSTDKIIMLFYLPENRNKYRFVNVDDKIYITFNQKTELPYFVNYEHNYRILAKPEPKYHNVDVYLDNDSNELLKVNFKEDWNKCFEILPISIQKIKNYNENFKNVFKYLPEKIEDKHIINLKKKRNDFMIKEFKQKSKNKLKLKFCRDCDKPFVTDTSFCKKCRDDYGRYINNKKMVNPDITFIPDEDDGSINENIITEPTML